MVTISYFNDFVKIIESIENDNTYKTAWGRAILECIKNEEYEYQGEKIVIYHYNLVQKIMKYYWNQIAFFNLSQGPSSILEARINEIKKEFHDNTRITYPVWYDKVESFLKRNPVRFERQVKKFITIANKGIAAKFEKIGSKKFEIYDLDTKLKLLRFTQEQVDILNKEMSILEDLIDYKWASLIEKYNKAPNIIRKVIGSKAYRFKRQNLIKYRNVLIEYYHLEGAKDFYTGELVKIPDISLEHVIPYHFIYGCNIWNLIITSKETAKKRRANIPSKEDIAKLNKRNEVLFKALINTKLRVRFELENALEKHLVDRFYIDLKG